MTTTNTNNTTVSPAVYQRLQRAIALFIGSPFLIAAVFTWLQYYPATYVIHWLANEEGTFSLRLAIVLNFALLMLPILVILLLVLCIKKLMAPAKK